MYSSELIFSKQNIFNIQSQQTQEEEDPNEATQELFSEKGYAFNQAVKWLGLGIGIMCFYGLLKRLYEIRQDAKVIPDPGPPLEGQY